MKLFRLALEEEATGVANDEIEYEFYGRLTDLSILDTSVGKEHQEQHQIYVPKTDKNAGDATIRVRKTIKDNNEPEYVLTTKTKGASGSKIDRLEVSIPTTKDGYDQLRIITDGSMRKDRYHFPIEGTDLVWELDMFLKPGAEVGSRDYHEWVKVDLELNTVGTELPVIPFVLEDIITAQKGKRTPEEEAKVEELYNSMFKTPNQLK